MTAFSPLEKQIAERLRPEHFQELEQLKAKSLWHNVPIWLWSPILSGSQVQTVKNAIENLCQKLVEFGSHQLQQDRIAEWLPADEGLLRSIAACPPEMDPCFNWRFDFLWERE